MFEKRLMKMCPESRKYIIGNVLLQWLELAMNAVMILMIALTVEDIWNKRMAGSTLLFRVGVILATLFIRWFTTRGVIKPALIIAYPANVFNLRSSLQIGIVEPR